MSLGFGPISNEPLCSLPHLSVDFIETCIFVPLATDPVADLVRDPLKRRVFAVEIAVLPLTGAPTPTFGTETVPTPAPIVPPPWAPTDIGATLQMWLDASDADTITLSTGRVSAWADKSGSGSGLNATQATAGQRPVVSTAFQNGLDTLLFSNTSDERFDLPSLTAFTAGTLVMVGKKTANNDSAGMGRFGSSGSVSHHEFSDGIIYDDFGSTVRKVVGDPTFDMSAWFMISIRSAANDWEFYLNGTSLFSTATNTVGFSATPIISSAPTFGWTGHMGEFALANSTLSTSDRQKLEGYMAWKWGIESILPVGHPYELAPPDPP